MGGTAMSVQQRARRLARLAGGATLILGLVGAAAGAAQASLAQTPGILPVVNRHAALSWGRNDLGQLGDGTTTSRSVPGGITGLGTGVVQVSAGTRHGLAVMADGTVRAWGDNSFGELGDGTRIMRTMPVQVKKLTGIVQVAAGVNFSLALRSDGTVWQWGNDQRTPVRAAGLAGITKIAAGGGLALALRSDGTVWQWFGNVQAPVRVTGLSHVTAIAAGYDAGYAIRTTILGTSLWDWGSNAGGQLGDGTTASHPTPERVKGIVAPGIAAVTAGFLFAAALGTDGSVWGWGGDAGGQLGDGALHNWVLRPVQTIEPGSGIIQLSASDNQQLFALRFPPKDEYMLALNANGTVLAWGGNFEGQLGIGSQGGLGSGFVQGLYGATQVSAGGGFSLAVYLPPQNQ
jgi:alpha-tubulin suppressor-like RCC1 family protein